MGTLISKILQFNISMKFEDKIEHVNFHTMHYIKQGFEIIKSIKHILNNTTTIDWMDLKSEITLPKIEEKIKSENNKK